MKTIRSVKVALPALVAILAMVSASPAVATQNLVLKDLGGTKTVADGSPAEVIFTIGEKCYLISDGAVVTNGAPKDVLSGTTTSEAECVFSSIRISGLLTETQLTNKGVANTKGSITLALSESCSYVFKNPKGATFDVPGWIVAEGTATGKLVKGSSKSCAPEDTEHFVVTAFGESLFEDSLS